MVRFISEWIEISNVLWPKPQGALIEETSPRKTLNSEAKESRKIMIEVGYL